ncbi:RNA-binding S4 domain-containing protein [Candidatus Eisenbacteria bacterium]|uniref:RNA-binding S4 domain-containing protein n=1 Tax=Eiseniibacteriota bacterium TaxID=2212470 RepID=A0ABV6YL90_UNCEI
MERIRLEIHTPEIRLDGALKFSAMVGTGGEAKFLIQSGLVRVNGEVETRRSHRVRSGDRIELLDEDGQLRAILEVEASSP